MEGEGGMDGGRGGREGGREGEIMQISLDVYIPCNTSELSYEDGSKLHIRKVLSRVLVRCYQDSTKPITSCTSYPSLPPPSAVCLDPSLPHPYLLHSR